MTTLTETEREAIEDAWPTGYVVVENGRPFYRYDTSDLTTQENGRTCAEIQERLRAIGWQIDDPCIEHDCISGPLRRVEVELEESDDEP